MKTIELVQTADSDKVIRVSIPVDEAARRYRLTVQIEPESDDGASAGLDEWPSGFFEKTAGKWVGDLTRPPQGDFEQRTPW